MRLIVKQLPGVKFGPHHENIPGFGETHNWTKKSIFWEIPYWPTLLVRHTLDVMHCQKNFFDNTKNTVMDDPHKTKDNVKARKDLELHARRKCLYLEKISDGKVKKPRSSYALNGDQKGDVCTWLKYLRLPDSHASNLSRCVNMEELKIWKMKSHDCHVFMQRLLHVAFRDFLPNNIWGALTEVSNFFRALCATKIKVSDMNSLQESIVVTICKLEKFFPPSFVDSMEHLAIHLPYEAKVCGPVQYHWMCPFERRMFHLKRTVHNKARVEGSICEAYLISKITHFCLRYFGKDVETRFNRLFRNEVTLEAEMEDELSIFSPVGRQIGKVERSRPLTTEEYYAAYLYILENCEEVDEWFGVFNDQMGANLSKQVLEKKKKTEFIPWFKHAIQSGDYEVEPKLLPLAHGPFRTAKIYKGYLVNRFRFHTEVVELQFWGSSRPLKLVLFKCNWYDNKKGMEVHPKHHLVSVNSKLRLPGYEPFIFASQAMQFYYCPYPSARLNARRRDWWAVCSIKARNRIDISSICPQDQEDGTPDFYQDNDPPQVSTNDLVDLTQSDFATLSVDEEGELFTDVESLDGEIDEAEDASRDDEDDDSSDGEDHIHNTIPVDTDSD